MVDLAVETWDRRIQRARQLAGEGSPATSSLLDFYAALLTCQKGLYEFLQTLPSESIDRGLGLVSTRMPELLRMVAANGPGPLAEQATELLERPPAALGDLLLAWWGSRSDRQFFAKAAAQPYFQWLADAGVRPAGPGVQPADNRCPLCGGAPQLSILESGGSSDGGGRWLLCATCLTPWPFRRVLCASCGEDDERRLGYFHAPAFDHLRLDTCDSCRRYLKTVDRTRLGLAVPIVDEVAGAPLDLWARERGYQKIELNLLGL